jgi:hypothetical protein
MPEPGRWGIALGLVIGGSVVLVSSLRYGLTVPLLLLGIVLAIAFGGLGLVAVLVRRRMSID